MNQPLTPKAAQEYIKWLEEEDKKYMYGRQTYVKSEFNKAKSKFLTLLESERESGEGEGEGGGKLNKKRR